MLLLSGISFVLAIASFYWGNKIIDDVMQFTMILLGLICILFSLIFSPWLIKLPILIGLLAIPTSLPKPNFKR
jgi:hypothetical protein